MARILIISFSRIATDPRVMRQINALRMGHSLYVAGLGPAPTGVRQFSELSTGMPSKGVEVFHKLMRVLLLIAHSFNFYYWNLAEVKRALDVTKEIDSFDLVIANDVLALPVALRIARGAPVLLDAHEYAPREFEDIWHWRLLFSPLQHWICRTYLPHVAGMSTVCQGIADEYARQFCVKPTVIPNCPDYQDLNPQEVNPEHIKLVHHGAAIRSRHIEEMLRAMQYLDGRYSLTLILVENDPNYMAELREMARGDSRIKFANPVPMHDIALCINQYDIGVFLLPPVNFNYLHALPNKFFEFIQARLAIAIGPSPEMKAYLDEWGCGVVAASFEANAFANAIRSLSTEDIWTLKLQAAKAAAVLTSEECGVLIQNQVGLLLELSWPP